MIKWLKERTRQEKWMIAIIIILVIGIILRWGFIKQEAGKAFKDRIEHFKAPEQKADTLPEKDSGGWNMIKDSVDL